MRPPVKMLLAALLVASLLSGCSSDNQGPADGGNDAGTDAGGDAGGTWSAEAVVDPDPASGLELAAAVDPQGHPAVAYFTNQSTHGGDGGIVNARYALVVARETSPGTWTRETVPAAQDGGALVGHYGLGLAFDPQGNPAVSYMGGGSPDNESPVDLRWHSFETGEPLPSDAVVARRGASAWTKTTLSINSAGIVTTGFGVDDQGGVTGLSSAIAFSPDGTMHLFVRDVHFGSDATAFNTSNLEYRQQSGATVVGELAASGRGDPNGPIGGGTYTRAVVMANGQPAISFALGTNTATAAEEVWFARRTGANIWVKKQLSAAQGREGSGPSLAYNSAAGFAVAYFDSQNGDIRMCTSPDGVAWNDDIVEALGETGLHPGAAFGGATHTQLGVLYAFCHGSLPQSGCDPQVQELRFRIYPDGQPAGIPFLGERISGTVPDVTALVADGTGKFVAIWRDPTGGVRASRRTP